MNINVYILGISTFIVGTVELIIGGTLNTISKDLHVSLSTAGQLITVFSAVYAFSAPVLSVLTSGISPKKLYIVVAGLFLIGNLVSAFCPNYLTLFIARILVASTSALLVVMSTTIATSIVPENAVGKAIGVVFMGISGSLVLGVPIGIVISQKYSWRFLYILISLMTLVTTTGVLLCLGQVDGQQALPFSQQIKTLKDKKIIVTHLVTTFMMAGHVAIYAYFTPFLLTVVDVPSRWISIIYFIFGVSAVLGGGIGGWAVDRIDPRVVALFTVGIFVVVLPLLFLTRHSFLLFMMSVLLWSMLSWAISPAQQAHLLQIASDSSRVQLGLNSSAIQLGVACGSALGGGFIARFPIEYIPLVGEILVLFALVCALLSYKWSASAKTYGAN